MLVFEKNWSFPYLKETLVDHSDFLFKLKNTFLSTGTGKWSVVSSATQSATGFTDLWTSPAAINLTGSPNIWCNLRYQDDNYLFYLLLRYNGGIMRMATSYDSTPTGGNSTIFPTANDLRVTGGDFFVGSATGAGNFCAAITSDATNIRFFNTSGFSWGFGVDDRFFDSGRVDKALFCYDGVRLRYAPYKKTINGEPYDNDGGNNHLGYGGFTPVYGSARPIQKAIFYGRSDIGHKGGGGIIPPDLYFAYHSLAIGDTLSESGVKKLLRVGSTSLPLLTPIPENF